MEVRYIRNSKEYKTQVTATKELNTDKIKTSKYTGKFGITPYLDAPLIFMPDDKDSLIKNFDLILKINDKEIKERRELNQFKGLDKINITVLRPKPLNTNIFDFFTLETVELKDVSASFISQLLDSEMSIWWVHPGSAASEVGFKKGDYILSVNGKTFKYWTFLQKYLTEQKDKNEIKFKILRNNQEIEISARQKLIKGERVTQSSYYELGISTYFIREANKIIPYIKSKTPFSDAIDESIYQTVNMTSLVFKAVVALVTGNISFDHLGGPIMMYEASGIALSYGWLSLFKLMAILSINLGLLNLLPIPMLDGGHILFILVESIRRKPVNQKFKEVVSFIGIMILVTVMILVFKNDIENFIFK
jgi:regulator of sigma E protease